jgi:photosystem II stability/assembly factor-like uncharacterized protein
MNKSFGVLFASILLAACTSPVATPTPSQVPATASAIQSTVPPAPVDNPTDTATPLPPRATPSIPLPFEPGQSLPLTDLRLQMKDSDSGWAVIDRHLFHTNSSDGSAWRETLPPERDVFYFLDANTAWAAPETWCDQAGQCDDPYPLTSSVTIWRTTDAGETWQPSQSIDLGRSGAGSQHYFSPSLFFLDPHTGWLLARLDETAAGQILFATLDGGQIWQPVSKEPLPMTGAIKTLAFANPLIGWAIEAPVSDPAGSRIWQTVDGGSTWLPVPLPAEAATPSGLALDCRIDTVSRSTGNAGLRLTCAGTGYAVEGQLIDDGRTWRFLPPTNRPYDEGFADDQNGWRLETDGTGNSTWLQHSVDGGRTWTDLLAVGWEQAAFNIVGADQGWALVRIGDTRTLLVTVNGGKSWSEIQPSVSPSASAGVLQALAATADPGPSPIDSTPLTALQPGSPVTIIRLYQMNASFGWGLEPGGHLLRTANEGETWRDVTPPAGRISADGFFPLGVDEAWATAASWTSSEAGPTNPAGPSAVVWHTRDGGKHWQAGQPIPLGWPGHAQADWKSFPSLFFLDGNHGWFWAHLMDADSPTNPPTFNKLFRTKDAGQTWQLVADTRDLPPGGAGLVFSDNQTGWTGSSQPGTSGPVVVFSTRDGGRTWQKHVLFDQMQLPAPFPLCRTNVTYIAWKAVGVNLPCPDGPLPFYAWTSGEGQIWRTWSAPGNEFILDGLMGWRMLAQDPGQAKLIQQTRDGGQTWKTLCAVDWEDASLTFIPQDPRLGWAVVRKDGQIVFMHTNNGGKYWYEIETYMANP